MLKVPGHDFVDRDSIRTSRSAEGFDRQSPGLKGSSSGWFWGTETAPTEEGLHTENQVDEPLPQPVESPTLELFQSPSFARSDVDEGELSNLIVKFTEGIKVPQFLDALSSRASEQGLVSLRDITYALNALDVKWDLDKVSSAHIKFRSHSCRSIIILTCFYVGVELPPAFQMRSNG